MSNVILPVVGAAVGFVVGGPAGAVMGANLGMAANNLFFPQKNNVQLPTVSGPRLSDLRVQVSSYGNAIPKVYGIQRLSGNVIWSQDIKEVKKETTTTQSGGGGKGGVGGSVSSSQTNVTYEYYATLAIAVCEGEVDEIKRVWADSKPLTQDVLQGAQGKYNVHLGTEDQEPDDIIGKYKDAGTYPAYRGLCYVVIEDFPLGEYGNRIPNFSFEIQRTVKFSPSVEDKIKDIILIPGAGEFVYSTAVHSKQKGEQTSQGFVLQGETESLNMHNYDGVANVKLALDQLQKTLPNLEWVGLVVTWFATSTDAGECTIIPKVEFQSESLQVLPSDWSVAGISRAGAEMVLAFDDGTPTYGGTPSDDTVIQICQELQARGLKVLFYPMPFVDTITPVPKPWRGRITPANASDASSFFTKTSGFNAFIRHYSQLTVGGIALKDNIDAFIIGSELVGMTGYSDAPGSYPAVGELVNLAALVKADVGAGVKVTYAGDWSEYHSTGGWFNMDPLWSSPNIDFVGIDSYFPITEDLPQSQITEDKIKEYWEKGEGWDYFYADSTSRTGKTNYTGSAYAWKNLEYWWSHTHTNPNSVVTGWIPKMKPIWFTEYGFPSVDAAANQPNVFYDPSSSESFFPRGSKGRINFQAQREALNATLDYLQTRNAQPGKSDLIPHSFLWTWDARPYPFWPDLSRVWQDSVLWPTGHWVNGKLGNSNLGAIVAELLQKGGLVAGQYDVSALADTVEGYIIQQPIGIREAIEQLAAAYFFDCVESDGMLKFTKRGGASVVTIPEDDLVPNSKGNVRELMQITYGQELELPQRVNLTYINRVFNYEPGTQIAQRQTVKSVDQIGFNLPLVLNDQQAKQIADTTLYTAWIQRTSYKLTLPPKYATVEPTDIITVTLSSVNHIMRVIKADIERNGLVKIDAVAEDVSTYDFYTEPGQNPPSVIKPPVSIPATIMQLIDSPPLPTDNPAQGQLRIAVSPVGANWGGAVIYRSDDGGETGGNNYQVIAGIDGAATMGAALNSVPAGVLDVFDTASYVDVLLSSGQLASVNELALLNGANTALLGNELIQFQNAELTGDKRYRLSRLLRGRMGTEDFVSGHLDGDPFILLTPSLYKMPMPNNLIGLGLHYKGISVGNTLAGTAEVQFTYTGRMLKPFAPVHVTGSRSGGADLTISWIRRTRIDGDWRDGVDVPLGEESERYELDIMDGADVVRTLEATSPTVTYIAADQVTDFGSIQESLTVHIYQLSAIVGRGYPAIAIL